MGQHPWRWVYSSAAWRKLRALHLSRHPLCALCQAVGRVTQATVVDHIVPHRGDARLALDQTNLQSLCKACHDGAKQSLDRSGRLRGADLAGNPVDPGDHWRR